MASETIGIGDYLRRQSSIALWLLVLRIRLKLLVWHLLAGRALKRLVGRALEWLAPRADRTTATTEPRFGGAFFVGLRRMA